MLSFEGVTVGAAAFGFFHISFDRSVGMRQKWERPRKTQLRLTRKVEVGKLASLLQYLFSVGA